jgi:hypothetical protein
MRNASFGIPAGLPTSAAMTQARPFLRRSFRPLEAASDAAETGGVLDTANVGPMKIGRFTAQRSCVLTHPVAMTRSSPDYVMIAVQLQGVSVVEQFGRSMQLTPGHWGLCDAPRPCVSTHAAGVEQLHFLIPREHVRLSIDPRFVLGRSFRNDSGVSVLLVQAMSSLKNWRRWSSDCFTLPYTSASRGPARCPRTTRSATGSVRSWRTACGIRDCRST